MGWLPWLGAEPELVLPLPVVLALILLMIEDMVYVVREVEHEALWCEVSEV